MRVLICETSWTVMSLSNCLKDAGFLMTQTDSEEDFEAYLETGRQDVMVVPLELSREEDLRRLNRLFAAARGKPILVLATKSTAQQRARALEAGADEVLSSNVSADLLAARLKALVLRANNFATPLVDVGQAQIDVMARTVTVSGQEVRLSPLEYEIFEALALRAGKAMSHERLMDQLYAWENEPDGKIIRVYLSKIRRKLTAAGASGTMIETHWGRGYQIACEEDAAVAA